MKTILSQLVIIFSRNRVYPSVLIPTYYWSWSWNSKGEVIYDNRKTLINYLKDRRTK